MGRIFRLQRDILDYEKQPLPLVGMWSNYSNNSDSRLASRNLEYMMAC